MSCLIKEKNWSKDMEKHIYEFWKNENIYRFIEKGPVFSIDTPPPYVNTPIHIGQATTYVLMDMFARFHRMIGDSVIFPLGLDRNGLPIEMAAEKKGASMTKMTREEFIQHCRKMLEESSGESIDSFLKLGISFNSWQLGSNVGDMYYTDSPEYRALTQQTFIDLWNQGLIYEDERINNYCPGCRTTIADAEIEYADLPSTFNDIIFTVKETGEKLNIATTRPELLCTCAMLIFNPDDARHKHLNGKTAITPIFKKEVPIRAHPFADMEKGTGLMMMCSMGDQTDIRFFREMNLAPVIAIDANGMMNGNAGFLAGMKVKAARDAIIEKLREENLLVSQKNISHRTPICERSKHAIEFISMPEFYLKQLHTKDDMKRIAKDLNFFAPHSRQILIDWIDSVSIDWPLSRRRYYATEIPLWYCTQCREPVTGERGKYVQPWREQPGVKCRCGSFEFTGETRVFDTWFDSANTPLYIMKYGTGFFRQCTVRPQGKEIVRTWLYYTLLKAKLLTGMQIFRDVWINYHIVDDKGKKMSKSVGNVIDPHAIIERFGAEPFRLWCAIEGNLTDGDMKCSLERIDGASKTLTKLWNVAKFVTMFKGEGYITMQPLDAWIIGELNEIVTYSRDCYEKYDFHNPSARIKHFIWETFASHYIELVKNRAYNENGKYTSVEQASAHYAMHHCLDTLLKLLAPITPFITYTIYKELHGKDVHFQKFPETMTVKKTDFTTADIEELNSAIWKAKRDRGQSLKAEVHCLTIPEKFAPIERDLIYTHSVKKILYGELSVEL